MTRLGKRHFWFRNGRWHTGIAYTRTLFGLATAAVLCTGHGATIYEAYRDSFIFGRRAA